MQENTESEKPEDFSENGEHAPEAEDTAPPENSDAVESDSGFEEQDGEFLPPEERKKSAAGKFVLFLILVLAGSGSYLYFNNLIPAEILNLVFPKTAPSKPPALITQTPLFMEEVAEVPVPTEIVETPIAESTAVEPPEETLETHISGNNVELEPTPNISGSDFDQTVEEKETLQETSNPEQAPPEEMVEEESTGVENPEEAEPIIVQEVVEEAEWEPITETITLPEPTSPEPEGPQRSKAAQAYLDFIESSVQKLGLLIEEGFNWCLDYFKKKLA